MCRATVGSECDIISCGAMISRPAASPTPREAIPVVSQLRPCACNDFGFVWRYTFRHAPASSFVILTSYFVVLALRAHHERRGHPTLITCLVIYRDSSGERSDVIDQSAGRRDYIEGYCGAGTLRLAGLHGRPRLGETPRLRGGLPIATRRPA